MRPCDPVIALLARSARTKLGNAWFTRKLSPGSRSARLALLTRAERIAAFRQGWFR